MELTKEWVVDKLPKRPINSNKGTFGKVLVIAGSENYPGAAYLTCAAAYRVGAGLVSLVTSREVKIIVSRKLPEVTFLSYSDSLKKLTDFDVAILGPGLGQKPTIKKFIEKLLKQKLPKMIIDGDGLNILSKLNKWWEKLSEEVILTPHPGEFSRLTGLTIDQIQSTRENIGKQFAKKWNKIIVLKGANTVVVSPAGEVVICPFANPLLATAGAGDVLAGIIGGLIAQGLKPLFAAYISVCLHGFAAEEKREQIGDAGLLASDLLPLLPKAIKKIKKGIDK